LIAIFIAAALLVSTAVSNLETRGIPVGIDFLGMPSEIVISESVLAHDPGDSHYRSILVGIANTLFVSTLVIILSTVCGLVIGLARLSENPLASITSKCWVELARNFPPIVILIFLYSIWWKVFPPVDQAWELLPGTYLSMRGLNCPEIALSFSPVGALGVVIGLVVWALHRRLAARIRLAPRFWKLLSIGLLVGGVVLADTHLTLEVPQFTGSNYSGGIELSPELSTILLGLTLYTTGFIAEIIRGGVLSINKGQWEAGRALGLSRGKILRFIVIPQTLRVIVPPLNSQYINVVKNSTLAIAVGYPDFLAVMNTMISKTSHSIEGVLIILGVYLVINLSLSTLANWYNRRVGLTGG